MVCDNKNTYDSHKVAKTHDFPVNLITHGFANFCEIALLLRDDLYNACRNGDFDYLHILGEKLYSMALGLEITQVVKSIKIIKEAQEKIGVEQALDRFYGLVKAFETSHSRKRLSFETALKLNVSDVFYEEVSDYYTPYVVSSLPMLTQENYTSVSWKGKDSFDEEVEFVLSLDMEEYGPNVYTLE